MIFRDRAAAGEKLAGAMARYKNLSQAIVLALPRGGVAVAAPLAKVLGLPLDIVVTRKIGAPQNEEMAVGAVSRTGEKIFDEAAIDWLKISKDYLLEKSKEEMAEAERRFKVYRASRPPPNLNSKIVILVDDGLATGLTARAAIAEVKKQNPAKIIVAVPVAAADTAEQIRQAVDELVILEIPPRFGAVGAFYENFKQMTDEEVINLLK